MSLLSNRQNIREVPPELQPYYDDTRDRTRFFGIIGGIVLVLLAIGLAIWFLSWRSHHDAAQTKTATSQSSGKSNSTSKSGQGFGDVTFPSIAPQSNSGQSVASGSTNKQATGAASATATSAPSTMPNTGPGAVFALVTVSAVAGGVAYEIRLHRKIAAE